MKDIDEETVRVRQALIEGNYLMAGGFVEAAARSAYMAVFHAAIAFIVHRTAKEPKTHKGVHAEFARLAREEPLIDHDVVRALSNYYEFKTFADYGGGSRPITADEAQSALDAAKRFTEQVINLLPTSSP